MSENTITVDTTVDNPTEVVEVPGTTKTPAQSVAESLKYSFTKDILVKPLAAVKVKKSFETQQPTGEKDENGFEKYNTITEVKKVDSDFSKGVVIALPQSGSDGLSIGDTIVYSNKFSKYFDLYKDSQLVKPYDVVAIVK